MLKKIPRGQIDRTKLLYRESRPPAPPGGWTTSVGVTIRGIWGGQGNNADQCVKMVLVLFPTEFLSVAIFQAVGFTNGELRTAGQVRIMTLCARMKNLAILGARRGVRLYPLLYPPAIFFELA